MTDHSQKTGFFLNAALSRRAALLSLTGMASTAVMGRLFSSPAQAAVGGELQIMAWEGYDLSTELADWRKSANVQVTSATIAAQDDVQAKFVAGNPPPIDLAEYNQAYADLYIRDMKIVEPIDVSKIPNYSKDNLFGVFYDQPTWFADGKHWGMPWIWGFNTLLYNPAKMSKPASYADLLDPKLKGKIAITDDATGSWPVAARVAGFGNKYPFLTRDELAKTFEVFTQYRDQARLIALNMGDLVNFMVSGEVEAALCADPAIIYQAAQQGVKLDMSLPKEGPVLWVDAWFIPISADNIETAHAFMNQALDPKVQAAVATAVVQAPVSKQAVALLDDSNRNHIDYSQVDAMFAAGLPGIPPQQSSDGYAVYSDWVEAWQQFKAGM